MASLLTPAFQPFTIAAGLLVGLLILEILSLLIGASILGSLDNFDLFDLLFGWLNLGKVPFLALLMVFLGSFAVTGFILQSVSISFFYPLPVWVASLISLAVTIPLTRKGSRLVERLIPHDETYATEPEYFIGRTGIVSLGPVQTDSVARIKIRDEWGNWHFPRACPAISGEVIEQGAVILVVDVKKTELMVTRANDHLKP